jgi:tetratricopeptide (TPR) repeat protein
VKSPTKLLLLLLGIALAIRLWGIHDRLPDSSLGINVLDDSVVEETDRTTMGRAWIMWRGGAKFDPNPHTGGWPALSFYLTLFLQYLYKLYYSFTTGGTTAQFQAHVVGTGAGPMFLYARVVGALIGALTIYLTYRIGALTVGRTAGLLAGVFLAANTLHVLTSQHVSDPNLLALLFVLLATPPLLRVVEGGSVRDSVRAGAMIGLAGACKYVPLILGVPLALAHLGLGRRKAGAERVKRPSIFKSKALWAGLLAILAALLVATPFLFIDWKRTVIDIVDQRQALFSDWVGQTVFPISLPTYLAVTLPHAMGWPAYLLGLAGMVLLWRGGRVTRTLVWIPALVVLVNGMLKSPQERYILVALPFLHIGAAFALVRAAAWAKARIPALAREGPAGSVAPALLAAVAIAWPLPELVATRHQLSLPDSRHLARRWVNQNLDPRKAAAVELYGPVFAEKERTFVVWPFLATDAAYVRAAYDHAWLDGLGYYITSGEIGRRFETAAGRYPYEAAFHSWIQTHANRAWTSDSKTVSGPRIDVWLLPEHISTREERDRLWSEARRNPMYKARLARWCRDLAAAFLKLDQYSRAEEWAVRGLTIPDAGYRRELFETVSLAEARLGKHADAVRAARDGLRDFPDSPLLHLNCAVALEALSRRDEAVAEYRAALRFSPNAQAAQLVRAQIQRLEGTP